SSPRGRARRRRSHPPRRPPSPGGCCAATPDVPGPRPGARSAQRAARRRPRAEGPSDHRIGDVPRARGNIVRPAGVAPSRMRLKKYEYLENEDGKVVRYRRHENGGGHVADGADVHPDAYIGPAAWVDPGATVEH